MSETCPVVSLAMPKLHMIDWEEDRLLGIICKTGLPIPPGELEVADPDDRLLLRDGVSTGEAIMRAPWLTRSYFKAPDKSEDLWRRFCHLHFHRMP